MLVGFSAKNHPQQTRYAGSNRDVDDRALPPEDFAKLNARFNFSIDVASSAENRKVSKNFTRQENGLMQSWSGERVYCNPPYSDIMPWIKKAWSERQAQIVVMLLPANRTEQLWWQNGIEPFRDRSGSVLRTEFMQGRLRFLKAGQEIIKPNERPPFGCVLCIWDWLGASMQVEETLFDA